MEVNESQCQFFTFFRKRNEQNSINQQLWVPSIKLQYLLTKVKGIVQKEVCMCPDLEDFGSADQRRQRRRERGREDPSCDERPEAGHQTHHLKDHHQHHHEFTTSQKTSAVFQQIISTMTSEFTACLLSDMLYTNTNQTNVA